MNKIEKYVLDSFVIGITPNENIFSTYSQIPKKLQIHLVILAYEILKIYIIIWWILTLSLFLVLGEYFNKAHITEVAPKPIS